LPVVFRRRLSMKLRQMNTRPVDKTDEMNRETYDCLRKEYERDLICLERLLNRSFAAWRTGAH